MKEFWKRGSGYHYHCTLSKGENTLEGQIARLAMRSMTAGDFDLDRMQQEYVEFMTTPGSHNDAYASSYHRMFFQNRAAGKPLHECPSNDGHNVDAIDGLIVPAVVLLGGAAGRSGRARRGPAQRGRDSALAAREAFVGELDDAARGAPRHDGERRRAEA